MTTQFAPRRIRRSAGLAVLTSLALIAAACGSDGDSTADSPVDSTATSATTAATAATMETTTDASDTVVTTSEDSTASTVATSTDPTSSDGSGSTPAGDGEFPVTVTHALGDTVIEAEPLRVVSVGYTEQDTLLAVGVVPVGVTDWYGDQPYGVWPWAQEALGGAEPELLSASDGFQYEKIAALDPDLIIGTNAGLDETSYRLLSEIAPTIAHPEGDQLYFAPWDDQARLIGQALGKPGEMETVIETVKADFATAVAAHPEFAGVSVAFLQNAFYDGDAIAYQDGLSTEFLTDLGFTIPSVLDDFESDGGQAYIPIESLAVLDDADVLLWATEGPNDRAALETEPLYLALEEVREGRLVFTDGFTAGAIYFTSPLSLPYVIEHLVPALASTIAGDGPATIDVQG